MGRRRRRDDEGAERGGGGMSLPALEYHIIHSSLECVFCVYLCDSRSGKKHDGALQVSSRVFKGAKAVRAPIYIEPYSSRYP